MKKLFAVCLPLAFAVPMMADQIYNSLVAPGVPNVPSLGYEATSTNEFGELIQTTGAANLASATIQMSDWAYLSEWAGSVNGTTITATGFSLPMTLSIYNVGAGNTVGSLIGSDTIDAFIPWRPEPTPGVCAPGSNNDYLGSDGQCYAGSLSMVSFTFPDLAVPAEFIYGIAYDTTDHGYNPTGVSAPYDSLNVALNSGAPTVGSNPLPDTAYWYTTYGGFYADGGAAGLSFRQDQDWTPYNVAASFESSRTAPTPEPTSVMLLGSAALLIGFGIRRRRMKN